MNKCSFTFCKLSCDMCIEALRKRWYPQTETQCVSISNNYGLKTLIPKHMPKSKIGILEQISAQNPYVTCFWGHSVDTIGH